jgi:hypothetical protein
VRLDARHDVLADFGHHGVIRPVALADEMQERLVLCGRALRCRHGRHRLDALAVGRHQQAGAVARHRPMPPRIAEDAGEIIDIRRKPCGARTTGILIHVSPPVST